MALFIWWALGSASVRRRFSDRQIVLFVPAVLIPLAIAGVFPLLFATFTLLDASLAVGAWVLLARE
jgi:hypothetical protein